MTSKPSSKGSNPKLRRIVGEAAVRAGEENNDSRMKAAGDRALALGQKAMREGKAGVVTAGERNMAIVEK